jgi:hypothetical protein
MAHRGKAAHITCSQHHRLGHNRPDARDGLPLRLGVGLWQQALDLLQGQRVHPLGT